jgi:hypothetical protein
MQALIILFDVPLRASCYGVYDRRADAHYLLLKKNKNNNIVCLKIKKQIGHMAAKENHLNTPEALGSAGILSLAKLLICYSALDKKSKIENQKVEKQGFLNSPRPL